MHAVRQLFGAEVNGAVLHAAVRAYLLNQRQGTQSTLTRTEVSGGGKKPWRQKGTGRARQGSTRAPQWTHGGVALGPKPRLYKVKLNKKVKRVAMFSALSSKVASGEMIVVDKIAAAEYKTKAMAQMLSDSRSRQEVARGSPREGRKGRKEPRQHPRCQGNACQHAQRLRHSQCRFLRCGEGRCNKIEEVYAE